MAHKANILVKTKNMEHDEWLEWRNKGIGASDAAVVMGLSRYKSALRLWAEKTGALPADDISQVEAVYWGTTLEKIVADEFQKRSGLKVQRCNAILQHPQYPFMLANVDRLISGTDFGLECKTAHAMKASEWVGDEVPDEYYVQCQHCMAVTGLAKWYIAVLIGGNKFIYKEIPRHDEFIEAMIEAETTFWGMVEGGVAPAIDDSDDCADALMQMHPQAINDDIIDSEDESVAEFMRAYAGGKEMEEAGKSRKEAAANAIKNEIGFKKGICAAGYKATWGNLVGRMDFDKTKFKEDHPDLYEKYIRQTAASRRFVVTKIKPRESGD